MHHVDSHSLELHKSSVARYRATDDEFIDAYIDVDEFRHEPIHHRYVHGGFFGTGTRFSFYFPDSRQYQGRFFQHVTPVPIHESLAVTATGQEDRIGFAASSGGYFVETNGGGDHTNSAHGAYRANAAAATFSRAVAEEIYGAHRPFGYLFGGSGGGYRTIGASENTEDVWDGFAPYVIGSPMAIPSVFAVRMHAQRILRDVLDGVADAMDVAGSGDPYRGLDAEQADALREVSRMGFPLRSWNDHRTMGTQAFAVLYPVVKRIDPGYFTDFWTVPGYLGADSPAEASIHRDRVRVSAKIRRVLTEERPAQPGATQGGVDNAFIAVQTETVVTGLELDTPLPVPIMGASLTVVLVDGSEASYSLRGGEGHTVTFDIQDFDVDLAGLEVGVLVHIDNSDFLAAQTYHRHQVPPVGFEVWDQFRDANGAPLYPQRPMLIGPILTATTTGGGQTGRIHGKMIVVASVLDREAYAWQAAWYADRVHEHFGDETGEHFRIWLNDYSLHGDVENDFDQTRHVSYLGVLHTALRDLAAWVEQGVTPAASTQYQVLDGQVELLAEASERAGVQPVVRLTGNGAECASVRAGETVTFVATAEVPPQAGALIRVAWDLDADGKYDMSDDVAPSSHLVEERKARFDELGTHFVTVRATSQREGRSDTVFASMDSLARVRVIVS